MSKDNINYLNKKTIVTIYLLLSCIYGCGAAVFPYLFDKNSIKGHPYHLLIERYRAAANREEKRGELRKALISYKIIRSLEPADADAKGNIKRLKSIIEIKADHHFKLGLTLIKSGLISRGRNELIKALAYVPDHRYAIFYLRQITSDDLISYHLAKPGETLRTIAKSVYNDPDKMVIIAYFNDLSIGEKPVSGTLLKYPSLKPEKKGDIKIETHVKPPQRDINSQKGLTSVEDNSKNDELLKDANLLLDSQDYSKAMEISLSILGKDKNNQRASDILYSALYSLGKKYISQSKFIKSLSYLNQLPADYRDTRRLIVSIEKKLRNDADIHYLKGVNYFLNEDLKNAIKEWNKSLALNPKHKKAGKDIKRAYSLLKRLNELD